MSKFIRFADSTFSTGSAENRHFHIPVANGKGRDGSYGSVAGWEIEETGHPDSNKQDQSNRHEIPATPQASD